MPEEMRMMPDPASPTGYSLKPVYRPPTPLEIARGTLNNYAYILGSYLTQQAAPRPSQFGRILQGMGYGQTPETVQAQQQRIQNLPLPMENRVRNAITQGVDYAGNFLAQGRSPEIGGAVRSMVEPVAQFPVTAVTDPLRAANQAQQALDPAYAMARGLTTTRLGAQEGNLGDVAAGVTEMGLAGLSFVPGGAAVKGARAMPPAPVRRPPPIGQPNVLAPPASRGPILNQLADQPELLGGGLGGALGATQGETPEERARNALLGAAGGAVGGRMARGMTPDRTRMGSNLGNLGKANRPMEIPKSDADEMVKIFNETLTPATKRLEQFKDALGDKYTWQRVDLQELEDMFGKGNIPPQALQAVKEDGSAILHGTDVNATWSKPSKAPTEEQFWADAAADEGWIENRATTLDDIFSPDMASKPSATLAAAEAMLHLARKEGWKASEVRGGHGRYWQLSKEKPNGEEAVVSVRVSDHARQSMQYDPKDINLAPQVGANNSEYAADDFTSMLKKLRAAEAADEVSPGASSNVLAPQPVQKAQAAGYEGADIGEAKEWVAARSKGLDMSQAARMERAKAMGFDTRYKLFHATHSNFDAFDTEKIRTDLQLGEDAIFLTNSPAVADSYLGGAFVQRDAPKIIEKNVQGVDMGGNVGRYYSKDAAVYPLYAKNLNEYELWDMGGGSYDPVFMQRAIKEAKENGAPGIILRGVRDPGIMDSIGPQGNPRTPATVVAVFNPKDVRSVNAAFDPASKESANILAGVGAVGAGAAMTGAIRPPEQKKPPGQRPRG